MERVKNLNLYQKGILLLMLAMALVFAVIYPRTISKVGFEYNDVILVPTQANGNTVYSGKLQGQQASFTVSGRETVVFQYGDIVYGPYTVKEDPTAIPKDTDIRESMSGVEIREGNDILFRGGVMDRGDFYWLYNEDGTSYNMVGFTYVTGDGIERDENGNPVDRMKPSVSTIYKLTHKPELTHKGEWPAWFEAVFLCILNAVSVLFADELFRFHLSFQVRDTAQAEPSDWEIAGRYIGWTAITIAALVLFIIGLQ